MGRVSRGYGTGVSWRARQGRRTGSKQRWALGRPQSEVLRVAPIAAPVRWRALPDVPGEKQSRRGTSETVEATYAAPNRADFGARSLREALRVRVARREAPERSEASYICTKAPPQRKRCENSPGAHPARRRFALPPCMRPQATAAGSRRLKRRDEAEIHSTHPPQAPCKPVPPSHTATYSRLRGAAF